MLASQMTGLRTVAGAIYYYLVLPTLYVGVSQQRHQMDENSTTIAYINQYTWCVYSALRVYYNYFKIWVSIVFNVVNLKCDFRTFGPFLLCIVKCS